MTAEGKAAAEKRIDTANKTILKIRQDYEKVINTPEERTLYNDWVKQWTEYETGVQETVALSRASIGKYPTEAQQLNEAKYLPIGQKADAILNKDIELNNKGADEAGRAADTQYSSAFMWLAIIIAAAGVVGITVGFYLVRDVSRGIDSIVSPMQALGQGNLAADVPHRGEATEIGKMADALQVFKEALIAKKAADEAAARDAEEKIARGQRVDSITRQFETMIGEIVETVSSASTELEASAGTLTSTAERAQELTTMVAAASEEASTNVQSVASATEEMTFLDHRDQPPGAGIGADRGRGGAPGAEDQRPRRRTRQGGGADRRRGRTDQHHRRPDQPAGAQRHHRGGAGRRSRPRLRGGRQRSEGAWPSRPPRPPARSASRSAASRARPRNSVDAIKEIGDTISKMSEIASTIASAVEEQGAATQEISRNVQQASQGTQQVSSNITDVQRGASETGSASSQVLSAAQTLSRDCNRLKDEVGKFLTDVRAA